MSNKKTKAVALAYKAVCGSVAPGDLEKFAEKLYIKKSLDGQ